MVVDWVLNGQPWLPPSTVQCDGHPEACKWNRAGAYEHHMLCIQGPIKVAIQRFKCTTAGHRTRQPFVKLALFLVVCERETIWESTTLRKRAGVLGVMGQGSQEHEVARRWVGVHGGDGGGCLGQRERRVNTCIKKVWMPEDKCVMGGLLGPPIAEMDRGGG